MRQRNYKAGDEVSLKANLSGMRTPSGHVRIVGILPVSDWGETQYKVRIDGENFDRRVLGSHIVRQITTRSSDGHNPSTGYTWLNPSQIKVRK